MTPTGPNMHRDECPACGYVMDCVTVAEGEDAIPRPGDISMCLSCGAFLNFDRDLYYQLANEQELKEDLSPGQMSIMLRARAFIRARGPIRKGEPD